MKKILFSFAVIAGLAACNNNAPEADKAATGEQEAAATVEGTTYALDTTSLITWYATKANGAHTGIFKVREGSVAEKDGNLTGGSFTIDVTSIANQDLVSDTANKNKLEGHLKSPDFFDIAKYPTAKFEITAVEPFKYDSVANKDLVMKDATHTIKGNLTLKDSTKNISFPAKVALNGGQLTALADFNIDRTDWGLNYKGPNNPADWFIRKNVNLKLDIKASKK
ncbi:MAG: YceI family protein [Bacteroidota bacterium]